VRKRANNVLTQGYLVAQICVFVGCLNLIVGFLLGNLYTGLVSFIIQSALGAYVLFVGVPRAYSLARSRRAAEIAAYMEENARLIDEEIATAYERKMQEDRPRAAFPASAPYKKGFSYASG
jgi:hypothetical protein